MYVSKESKQVSHNSIHFMQVNDPDENKSWYELGQESKQVGCNAIQVHSTVYMYVSKESKQVSHNSIHFMQVNDPDENKSWYELGQKAGLYIVENGERRGRLVNVEGVVSTCIQSK